MEKFFLFFRKKNFLHDISANLGIVDKPNQIRQSEIDMVKLLRVYGECLGVERRRRTWLAAKSPGQVSSNR